MNWISNYVRPRINSIFSRREVPENLWTKCDECGTMLFHRELADNLNVCTSCDHHMAITPRDRFKALCARFEVSPAAAAAAYGRSAPGVVALALSTSQPERVAEMVTLAHAEMSGEFEAALMAEGLIG